MVRMVRCLGSEQVLELPRWSLRRSFWWSASLQRGALRALADLYVGCALLATRSDLYLDAPGLPSRCGTFEGHLQDAVLVTGVDLLLIYTFGQDHAPLERAVAQLPYVVASALLFLVDLALAGDGQHPIVDRDMYVLGLYAGHLDPNHQVPVFLKHVH